MVFGDDKIETKNAVIEKTMLGYEDHGIFTYMLTLDYGGSGQGFGGICMGGNYTDAHIQKILKTLKLEKWEDLRGTKIRAKSSYGKVHSIGHFLEDRWFTPEELKLDEEPNG